MADDAPAPELTPERAAATMASRGYLVLLVIVAVVGVLASFATWVFLELIHQVTQELYTHLPHALGYPNGPPVWWPLPVLGIAGAIVALVILRLPGNGGHIPAKGLAAGGSPSLGVVPGVALAGLVSVSFGVVLGPEAPLLALGPGVALLAIGLVGRKAPPQMVQIVAAAGAFAALSFLFVSPLIAAIIMIEASGIGGPRLPLVVVPGLLAAGIGSLLALGLGSWTGLNRSAIALGPIQHLPVFAHLTIAQFGWTIALALVIGICARLIMRGGLLTYRLAAPRPLVVLPVAGLVVAGLAIAFSQATGKSSSEVLFSGESGLPGLVAHAASWSLGALALLLVFKGLAYGVSLGSFRGGPTFPAVFLGVAGGILASHLPGFPLTPAVAVGMGAGVAAVLKLPLSAIVLATLLTSTGGVGDEPLIIVGVIVAYLVAQLFSRGPAEEGASSAPQASAPADAPHPDGAQGAVAQPHAS